MTDLISYRMLPTKLVRMWYVAMFKNCHKIQSVKIWKSEDLTYNFLLYKEKCRHTEYDWWEM